MSAFIVPMADCHVHVNGMLDDKTLVRLADKYGEQLPTEYIQADGGRRDWSKNHVLSHQIYDAGVKFIRQPEDTYL
nr:hypothetical protein [Pseudomonadota bacterium]